MFNLLLPQDKVAVYREYMTRLVIVALGAFICLEIIGVIALLPSYILLRSDERTALVKKTQVQNQTENSELTSIVTATKISVDGLHTTPQILFRELIAGITQARGQGIKLNDIEYITDAGKIHLQISGVAQTRQSLVVFSKELQKNPLFGSVEVPISDFVKEKNIEFSLDIKGR